MTVKTIFKTLIGTIVAIVVGFIIIEVFNLSITQFMLRQTQRLAVNQAAQLFSQETYKSETKDNKKAKQTVFADIKLGQTSIQGKFYNVQETQSVQAYYNSLYSTAEKGQPYGTFLQGKYSPSRVNDTVAKIYPALGNSWYSGNFVTPANFGIPYLDKQFMEKQFKWNIAMLFGQPDKNTQTITGGGVAQSQYTIPNSGTQNGKQYINYSGYRIYVGNNTNTKITNINYKIYDISKQDEKQEFMKHTNIDPDKLTNLRSDPKTGGYSGGMSLITQVNKEGMQVYLQNLMIAKIDYTVEIGYEGITPIKNVIEFVQGYRVKGLNSKTPAGQTQGFNEDATHTLTGTVYYWTVA